MGLPRVLFRVDAGRRHGLSFGHLYRCLALASEIAGHADPVFLIGGDPEGKGLVRRNGFTVADMDAQTGADALVDENFSSIVFDLPQPPLRMLKDLCGRGCRVIVLDDRGGKVYPGSVMINANIDRSLHPGETHGTELYLGPRFCVLGTDFDGRLRQGVRGKPMSVLVTFGGSDPSGLTADVVRALADRVFGVKVNVVLGPGFAQPGGIEKLARSAKTPIRLHHAVDDLCALMLDADVAVAAGGRTAYELSATGTPALLIPSIEHEEPVTCAFAQVGAALDLGRWTDSSPSQLCDHLAILLKDSSRRERMSRAGPQLVDGLGRKRVASILIGAKDAVPVV